MTTFLLILAAVAEWLNPAVNRVNTEQSRASFFAYETERLAQTADKAQSQRYLSLEGTWKFHWAKDHNDAPTGFYKATYNDSQWTTFPVPGLFELNGYGDRIYRNSGYAWSTQFENKPGWVEEKNNYTGSYRQTFRVPAAWKGQQVYFHLGSATSNFRLWINGKEVGYSEDSKLEAEWDVTAYIVPGKENLICMQVMRWCDGSYGEDQDFWRFTGIAREVYLYARPKTHLADLNLTTTLTNAYADGQLTIEGTATAPCQVSYTLKDAAGKAVWSQQVQATKGKHAVVCNLAGAETWSCERPYLYTLQATLADKQGNVIESTTQKVGFRSVEIAGAQLLINGKPVLIKGADRHELDPDGGYVVSVERMLEDIRIMRELNMNAVRTCHYPDDPRWYDLCDQYGIMVVAEANFESHGMGYGERKLAAGELYRQTIVERNEGNVRVNRNHPSVIVWSLGNESGYGENFEAAYDAVKALDASRPVQYEQAGQNGKTDIFCPMYYNYENSERYAQGDNPRPLIQCEYAHAMGNSMGGFKEYWDLVRKYPKYQGGFIWDFVDQGISGTSKVTGQKIWMYGGDEGRYPASDHNFNCNGVIAPDRSLNPHAYEVQYYYQNIWVKAVSEGSIDVYNEQWYEPTRGITITAEVQVNGQPYGAIAVACPEIAPQETQTVKIQGLSDLIAKAKDAYPYDELMLNIDFALDNDPLSLLPKGYVVARHQQELQAYTFAQPGCLVAVSTDDGKDLPPVSVDSMLACYTMTAQGLSVTVNRYTGELDYVDYNGTPLLAEGYPVTPNFWRAPTDNDYGASLQNKFRQWKDAERKLESVPTVGDAEQRSIIARYTMKRLDATLMLVYTLYESGELAIREVLDVNEDAKDKPQLFRFGMQWVMPEGFDRIAYHGRGPIENYVDRKASQRIGHYESTTADEFYAYIRPQENGNHTDVRQWSEPNASGLGLAFYATAEMEVSALHYLPADLDDGTNKGAQQSHSGDLTPRKLNVVQVQQRQLGLGCVNSWGAWPRPEYQLPYADYDFTYLVAPVQQ